MSYQIGNEFFKTKKALTERIRSILYSYDSDSSLNEDDQRFMMDVFKLHPSVDVKFGNGVKNINVRRNNVFKKNREFWILREDETETDISFLECLTPTDHLKKFKNACRSAVKKEIIQFRITNLDHESLCPITGIKLTKENVHVDHTPPNTFDFIVNEFIRINGINPKSIKLTGDADREISDQFVDTVLSENFVNFHNSIASLRLVSSIANLSDIKKI